MAQTSCPKCGKSFRAQTGLAWHVERSHPEARQAMLTQDQPKEVGTPGRADVEELQETLAKLGTGVEMVTEKQTALEAKMDEQAEKTADETKDKLQEWLEARLFNVLKERFVPLEQRANSLESELRALKRQEDGLERKLDSLDQRTSALEPKRDFCSLPRKPGPAVRQ